MSLLQQLVQFLSQPPDSLVYHVVTLLSLQAIFWLSVWQLRRRPGDNFAHRLLLASGGIMLGRLIILFASLAAVDPAEAASILPPLERAVDTASAILLVWALAPQSQKLPRLGDVLVLILLVLTGFLYAFFAQEWITQVEAGATLGSYTNTFQATIWEVLQLGILGVGGMLILIGRAGDWPLRLAVVIILIVAHILNLIFQPSQTLAPTDIAYWVRLGNLLALPTLAILCYRHNLATLIPSRRLGGTDVERLTEIIRLSQKVIQPRQTSGRIKEVLEMAAKTLECDFGAIATINRSDTNQIQMIAVFTPDANNISGNGEFQESHWDFNLNEWPSFRQAIHERKQIELFPDGPGARQLHEIYDELGIQKLGSLLVEPLFVAGQDIGLFMVAGAPSRNRWADQDKTLSTALGGFFSQAILNMQWYEEALHAASILGWSDIQISDNFEEKGNEQKYSHDRIIALSNQATNFEKRLEEESQHLQELTLTLAAVELMKPEEKEKMLLEEIESLREALIEAEEAMALAAASDSGISTEWVMRTVSRYSGDLERAESRISLLERQLAIKGAQDNSVRIIELTQELRTPLTALGVYADLLLSESLGILSSSQSDLVQRIRSNIVSMSGVINGIINLAGGLRPQSAEDTFVDIREVIDSAINLVAPQLRTKSLQLDLNVEENITAIPSYDDSIYLIIAHLLFVACEASVDNGRVAISAHQENLVDEEMLEKQDSFDFLHLTIEDSGKSNSQLLYSYFNSNQLIHADDEVGDDGDTGSLTVRLVKAANLIAAHGGRSWVEYDPEVGCTITILLPIFHKESELLD